MLVKTIRDRIPWNSHPCASLAAGPVAVALTAICTALPV